jgi:glycosyltransferase involved in cell wall biosynthesis
VSSAAGEDAIRVVRVISRLNVGGPAIQAITLTRRMEPLGYATTLVRGQEDPDEGDMDYLAEETGVTPVMIGSMRRNLGWRDPVALVRLVRLLRRERPHLVHTHAAKAGTLGRTAVLLAFRRRRRPRLVHTFHGHSLTGYFSDWRNRLFRGIERGLASRTDRLVAVSPEVRDELVEMEVAPDAKFEVVQDGYDLSAFALDGNERARRRAELRRELGIPEAARVVTLVARLVPIKRVDRFLRIARRLAEMPDVVFLVVGDGELRDELRASEDARALGGGVVWAGMRRDMPDVHFASDVAVLTSDNEGTPSSLIEAAAAGLPAVGTEVGGMASVIHDGETGHLAAVDDEAAFAARVRELLEDPRRAADMGARARQRSLATFGLERLVGDFDRLYRELGTDGRRGRSQDQAARA